MADQTQGISMTFGGLRVIESEWLTQDGEPVQVRRTWRERLFSRPWRPLQATRTVIPQVPYQGAMTLGRDAVVMHPAIARQMREMNQIRSMQ